MINSYLQAVTIINRLEAAHKDISELEDNDLYCEAGDYIQDNRVEAEKEAYSHYWILMPPIEREYSLCPRCKCVVGRQAKFCKMCGQRVRP